ncbi:MAG TPA: lysine-2,3-aminomutase-like protein [Candidatus Saccharimonadales bacterium]|jgi:lysine 2,3-aminomutase|nr:lysine-2,3-aminomutase-like protein [Candidatus Saccharimonadales bacterium]
MGAPGTATLTNKTVRTAQQLVELGLIRPEQQSAIEEVEESLSVAISPHFLELIQPGVSDPIARQFVPSPEELLIAPGELADPIGDDPYTAVPGITHRYPDRLLLKPIHVCPVYCRFCFRREKVGTGGESLSAAELAAALQYISDHKEVWEVILSGGDPLILSDAKLIPIFKALHEMPHVQVIRIHTRYMVANPSRITDDLVKGLKGRAAVYIVLHCNHAKELTEEATAACARLVDNGIPLLSQSVLLAGVNDTPEDMEGLMRAFVQRRVKPYYLHHLDLARGTSHFRTTIQRGQELMRLLRGRLSGLCQPTYVLDIPGGFGKTPIGPSYLSSAPQPNSYMVEDYKAGSHLYVDRG